MHSPVDTPQSQGFFYVAVGDRWFNEALISARSVKKWMPDIPIAIFTDSSLPCDGLFEQRLPLTESGLNPFQQKLACLAHAPYGRAIFLDSDTYICEPITELFDLLDHFDIAMTHDRAYTDYFPEDMGVPDCFREFNSGVVAFRRTDAVREVFQKSLNLYEQLLARGDKVAHDQVPLRIALYKSDLRIAPLTFEYNCRFATFGHLNGRVKILHARPPRIPYNEATLQEIANRLNRVTIPRVFVAGSVYALAKDSGRPFRSRKICDLFPSRTSHWLQRAKRKILNR
ncbi:hypothetical protein EON83_00795 [bacterium]|nr:MAG: hypothetical protein EON83_00795 [bacterium]